MSDTTTVECHECGGPATCRVHTRDSYRGDDGTGWAYHDVPVIEPTCDECADDYYPDDDRMPL